MTTSSGGIISLILGSAAVGALVSSLITLLGQRLERYARQRELLLTKAIELALLQVELVRAAADKNKEYVEINPHIVETRWMFGQLSRLLSQGQLSRDMEEDYAEYLKNSKG